MDQQTEKLFDMLPDALKEQVTQDVNQLVLNTVSVALQNVEPADTPAAAKKQAAPKRKPETSFAPPPKVAPKPKRKAPAINGENQVSADEVREQLPGLLEPGREYARREIIELCTEKGLILAPHKMTNQVLGRLIKDGVLVNNGEKTQKMKYRLA